MNGESGFERRTEYAESASSFAGAEVELGDVFKGQKNCSKSAEPLGIGGFEPRSGTSHTGTTRVRTTFCSEEMRRRCCEVNVGALLPEPFSEVAVAGKSSRTESGAFNVSRSSSASVIGCESLLIAIRRVSIVEFVAEGANLDVALAEEDAMTFRSS